MPHQISATGLEEAVANIDDIVAGGYRRVWRDEGFEPNQQRLAAGFADLRHDHISSPHPHRWPRKSARSSSVTSLPSCGSTRTRRAALPSTVASSNSSWPEGLGMAVRPGSPVSELPDRRC